MKYCRNCGILIPQKRKICSSCGSGGITVLSLRGDRSGREKEKNLPKVELFLNGNEYQVDSIIGTGGYGVILRVERKSDKKRFALKIPLGFLSLTGNCDDYSENELKYSSESVEGESEVYNLIEGERLLLPEDSGIVCIRYKGKKWEFPSILLELAEGTLKDLIILESEGRIKPGFGQKIEIARQIIEDLKYLHDKNVVHRDIALENIFIVDRGEDIFFVMGDFGTSKIRKAIERSTSTKIIGKEKYLDPARLNKKYRSDPRIDMFTAGIVITEVFIGDLWDNIIYEPLSEINFEEDFLKNFVSTHLNKKLIKFIARTLKPEIEKRFRNTDEMRKNFEKITGIRKQMQARFKVGKEVKILFNVKLPIKYENELIRHEIDYENHRKLSFSSDEKLVIYFKGVSICNVRVPGQSFLDYKYIQDKIEIFVNMRKLKKYMSALLLNDHQNDRGILYFQNRMKFSYLIERAITDR